MFVYFMCCFLPDDLFLCPPANIKGKQTEQWIRNNAVSCVFQLVGFISLCTLHGDETKRYIQWNISFYCRNFFYVLELCDRTKYTKFSLLAGLWSRCDNAWAASMDSSATTRSRWTQRMRKQKHIIDQKLIQEDTLGITWTNQRARYTNSMWGKKQVDEDGI